MRRIGLAIVLLGVMLWITGCGESEPAKPAGPAEPAPEAQPKEQPPEQPSEQPPEKPDEASAPAKTGPDGKKITGAVGSALLKGLTGGSGDEAPPPGTAPPFRP
jgi:hypothetical protein